MSSVDGRFTFHDGVDLKEHLEKRIADLEKRLDQRAAAMEKATELARDVIDGRLEGMNAIREQLRDQAGTFVTKPEYTTSNQRICDLIDEIKSWQDKQEGKASQSSVNVNFAIAAISLLVSIVSLVVKFI